MTMDSLATMDKLDSEPTPEEINQALDQLFSSKAPGNDDIPVEVIKRTKRNTPQVSRDTLPMLER